MEQCLLGSGFSLVSSYHFGFGIMLGSVHGLLLTLFSGVTLGAGGPYSVLGINQGHSICSANTLNPAHFEQTPNLLSCLSVSRLRICKWIPASGAAHSAQSSGFFSGSVLSAAVPQPLCLAVLP